MDRTDWAGPHQCCADFGAILRTERTGQIMRCAMCRFEWAVPFSDQGLIGGWGPSGSSPRLGNSAEADSRPATDPRSAETR